MSNEYIAPWLASNILALVLLFFCWKYPRMGRYGYALVFLIAAITNTKMAIDDPEVYLNYGELAILEVYEDFINGFFASHTRDVVMSIALCQFLISVGLFIDKIFYKPALIGATFFAVALIPLGVGAAFPMPLLMVISFWLLYFEKKRISPRSVVT